MMTGQGNATAAGAARDIEVGAAGGLMLRGRWWRRVEPRGAIVIAHGFGEHGGTYCDVAESLGRMLDVDIIAVGVTYRFDDPAPRPRDTLVRKY